MVVCTVVNPSQEMATIELPADAPHSKILYADGGYQPVLRGKTVKVGPEQLVVVGFGEYANQKYDMGVDDTIHIPAAIGKIHTQFTSTSKNVIERGGAEITRGTFHTNKPLVVQCSTSEKDAAKITSAVYAVAYV